MSGLGFNGLGWIWAKHILLNGPKWANEFLRIQPIDYPSKPTHLTPLHCINKFIIFGYKGLRR